MKQIPTIFLLALTGGAAYYFLKGKKEAIENLIIKPIDIAIDTNKSQQAGWLKLYYNIKFKITNPSGFKVNINSINLDFIVNNKVVANIEKNEIISIPPNVTQVITISSSIASVNVISLIMDLLADSSNIKLAISGIINTDLGAVNIAYQKNV